MSNNLDTAGITNLEQVLSKLGMTKFSSNFESSVDTNIDSLVNDPVFKTFQEALKEEYSDLPDRWQETFSLQVYPDPIEYLAPVNRSGHFFHIEEPEIQVDYKQMRENLHNFQDYIPGGQQTVTSMYEFINAFNGAHVDFVRSSIAMHGYQLYSKMADRFYGYVRDLAFEDFVKQTVEYTDDTSAWPPYLSVQSTLHTDFTNAELAMQQAAQQLVQLKSSSDLTSFNANIEAARSAKQSADAESILSKYIGSQTRAERARRKAAVSRRNVQNTQARVTKNAALRRRNQENIHQFGCMSRTPITEHVLRALTILQVKYSDDMYDEEEAETEIEVDEEEKKVVAKMKGLSVAAKFGGDAENMEEVMKVQEPMGGILVTGGYHVVDIVRT